MRERERVEKTEEVFCLILVQVQDNPWFVCSTIQTFIQT